MKADKSLLAKVAALGFPLMEVGSETDANATLAEVVKSDELRLWEGFPVLLMRTAENGLFNYEAVKGRLTLEQQKTLDQLLLMSLVLYKALGLKFSWTAKLYRQLPFGNMDRTFQGELAYFRSRGVFKFHNTVMSAPRLKNALQNYFQESDNLSNVQLQKENLGLEYALSQVFSPKQKELFLKRVRGEKLTKTEREYYSRSVRKKVTALANEDLHRLAKNL